MITIGHRGAAGHEPENTIQSFKKAIELNAEMIEFDVQLCKSGEVVVIHDFTLERTTNGHGFLSESSLSELKKLDAGKIIREISKHIQGGGGGQAFFATAGGKKPEGIAAALKNAKEIITNL